MKMTMIFCLSLIFSVHLCASEVAHAPKPVDVDKRARQFRNYRRLRNLSDAERKKEVQQLALLSQSKEKGAA